MCGYADETLAEMHLNEYLLNMTTIVNDALRVFDEAVGHMKDKDLDYDRIYNRILEPKRKIEENRLMFLEYLIRLSEGLPYREYYASIARGLERFVQLLDGAVYRISLFKRNGSTLEENLLELLTQFASTVKLMHKTFTEALEKLKIDPKKSLVKITEVYSLENKADEQYRRLEYEIYSKLSRDITGLMILRDAIDFMEDACDTVKDTGEELRYLALSKILVG
jgi:hypothetical protein